MTFITRADERRVCWAGPALPYKMLGAFKVDPKAPIHIYGQAR
jgi:hypothetical protein